MRSHAIMLLVRLLMVFVVAGSGVSVCAFCTENSHCPNACRCVEKNSRLIVDCDGRDLDSIPSVLPMHMREAVFTQNFIRNITREDFRNCTDLCSLDLGHNTLTSIDEKAFVDLGNLVVLHLDNNMLILNDNNSMVFTHQEDLQELFLHGNHQHRKPTGYSPKLFQNLPTLRNLTIDSGPNSTDWSIFMGLGNLTSFHVFGLIDIVHNDTFEMFARRGSPRILEFGVHSVTLRTLEPLAFSHFHQLRTLDLSFNENLGFANMSRAWYGLQSTNTSELVLTDTNPSGRLPVILQDTHLKGLDKLKIKSLILDNNHLVLINATIHHHLPGLERLSTRYNVVQNHAKDIMGDLRRLTNLTFADMSYYGRQQTFRRKPFSLPQGNMLYRRSSMLDEDTGNEWGLSSGRSIENDFDGNGRGRLQQYGRRIDRSSTLDTMFFVSPPNLKTAILSHVDPWYFKTRTVPNMVFLNAMMLEYLDYSGNGMQKWIGTLFFQPIPIHPFSFIINSNGIQQFSRQFFQPAVKVGLTLNVLDLSQNRLGEQLEKDDGSLWRQLRGSNISELNLANNGIRSLCRNAFQHIGSVQILNLSMNALHSVNFSLSCLLHLENLDLSDNLIYGLDKKSMQELEEVATNCFSLNVTLRVDLSRNVIQCNCRNLAFLHWIARSKVGLDFADWGNYECFFNDRAVRFAHLNTTILPSLDLLCRGHTILVIAGSLLGAVLVTLVISVIAYRHRWDIKFVCLKLSRGRKRFQTEHQRKHFRYDAFVAYHNTDLHWVVNQLMPKLQDGEDPFKLCVHHRDWLVGAPIAENVLTSIESSRKTILVLSKEFAKSEWCEFEAQVATGVCFQERLDLIVAVMREKIPASMMSSTLANFVRKNTYIEWPSIASSDPGHVLSREFWDKLREAIRNPGDRPLVCECGRKHYSDLA